jgi:hypothetical protein
VVGIARWRFAYRAYPPISYLHSVVGGIAKNVLDVEKKPLSGFFFALKKWGIPVIRRDKI